MSLIQEGIDKGLIIVSEDNKTVKYLNQNKTRNLSNPEGKVHVEAFFNFVLYIGVKEI